MCCASMVKGAVLIKRTKLFNVIASSCCALRDSGRSYKCEGTVVDVCRTSSSGPETAAEDCRE